MDHCGKFKFDSTFLAFEFFGFILVHCVSGAKLVLTNGVSISFVSDSVSPPISTMNYLYNLNNTTFILDIFSTYSLTKVFFPFRLENYYFLSSFESRRKGPIICFFDTKSVFYYVFLTDTSLQ